MLQIQSRGLFLKSTESLAACNSDVETGAGKGVDTGIADSEISVVVIGDEA